MDLWYDLWPSNFTQLFYALNVLDFLGVVVIMTICFAMYKLEE